MNPSSYASLPERFFARVQPTRVAAPQLIKFNHSLAADLNLDLSGVDAPGLADLFSGNLLPRGTVPVAMAYAGHQFGHFVPQLGDGRAILIGEARDRAGVLRDIQLKGSGRTPYSRSGDGRAALGPVLREYLVSEAMHALEIPTTRSLAAVSTGEFVQRETPLPGAIVTRVAASHIRVGTFEYFAARGDVAGTKILADYVIDRHYPLCAQEKSPYLALLEQVVSRQAALVAQWMNVGFIHGVMNTDNMAVSGETIDFGPCAFMDTYDPATVFSSIDERGRYAFANQPSAAIWNLARFAETLLPLMNEDPKQSIGPATEAIGTFETQFKDRWLDGMRRKLGLTTAEPGDREFAEDFLKSLQRREADFTLSFRALADSAGNEGYRTGSDAPGSDAPGGDASGGNGTLGDEEWMQRWRARVSRESTDARLRAESMRQANPAYIPRNHRVEQVIVAAVERGDFAPFEELSQVLAAPGVARAAFAAYANPPKPQERVLQTFCGT